MTELASAVASLGPLLAGVMILLATLGLVLRMRILEKNVTASIARHDDAHHKIERALKELAQGKNASHPDIATLHAAVRQIAADIQRLISVASQSRALRETSEPPRPSSAYREPSAAEDGLPQLLAMANRLVQQGSTTVEAFRASAGALSARVVAWPSMGEATPAAFIVDYHGSCYAIPNVVKPARLPDEWFNRADFGVNDEIERVLSLPRLRRRGNDYDVQDAGVFAR